MLRQSQFLLKKRSIFHKYTKRVNAAAIMQSYHTTDSIDPFSKFQWIAHPFQPHNMPSVARDAKPHKSLKAISHYDETKGWFHIIDAKGWGVGQLSKKIAKLLMGYHRLDFRSGSVNGDSVILVNAIHVTFPGHTWDTKMYRFWRTRRSDPRGCKIVTAKRLMFLNPSMIMNMAVKRMLPNSLTRGCRHRKFYCYPGAIHPHWNIPQVYVPVTKEDHSHVPTAFSVISPRPEDVAAAI